VNAVVPLFSLSLTTAAHRQINSPKLLDGLLSAVVLYSSSTKQMQAEEI
jgi:hypothetical protein